MASALTLDNHVKMEATKELARRDFFHYCHVKAKDFYRHDRGFLVELCTEFQDFIASTHDVLVVNLPP